MMSRTRFWLSTLAIASILAGCTDDGVSTEDITRDDVLGEFSAVTLETNTDGTLIDHLAQGASLDITLHENGTTTGRFFVPEGGEDGEDLDADLAGTFSFDDGTDHVTFNQDADTFIRDVTFDAVRSDGAVQLEGEETVGETILRVVLR